MFHAPEFVNLGFVDIDSVIIDWPGKMKGLTDFVELALAEDEEGMLKQAIFLYGDKKNTKSRKENFYNLVHSIKNWGYLSPITTSFTVLSDRLSSRHLEQMLRPENWLPRIIRENRPRVEGELNRINEGRHRLAVWKSAGIKMAPVSFVAEGHFKTAEEHRAAYAKLNGIIIRDLFTLNTSWNFWNFRKTLFEWGG